MQLPMNRNIEVLASNLWALKFSYIPFIAEIEYTPLEGVQKYEEFGNITPDGILLLNKDNRGYLYVKNIFLDLTKMNAGRLKRLKQKLEVKAQRDTQEEVLFWCVSSEIIRRKIRC